MAIYEYAANNGPLTSMIYGNGQYVDYTYDEFDRVVKLRYDSGRYITYSYDAIGALSAMTYGDGSTEKGSYIFEYDSLGRLLRSSEYDGSGTLVQQTEHGYDGYGRLQAQYWTIGATPYSESYSYNDGESGNGSLKNMTAATGDKLGFTYDTLNRLQRTTVTSEYGTAILNTAYAYRRLSSTQTSAQVEFRNVRLGSSASSTPIEGKKYSYDSMGNITLISQSTGSYYPLIAYEYDSQNQLIKETYYDGKGTGSAHVTDTYEYTYDTAGNILSEKKNGTVTKTYTYGDSQWKDLLTAVNGQTITYDAGGNPTVYRNGTGIGYDMSWTNGRQLSYVESYYGLQARTNYTYDANGIRIKKDVEDPGDGWISYYVTQNGKIVEERRESRSDTKVFHFIYDESGRPFALKYSTNGGRSFTTYYYVLNLQGDVVKLINKNGATYASYTYDAWGKVLTATGSMANINPLRYRGYYYDEETHFYYLQSRYYDPANHRFINADSFASTGQGFTGANMFAYCNNNPIILDDSEGNIPNYCTMLTDSGSKVIGGKTGENHRYIIAPENYSVTITSNPPDHRLKTTITMTYYTPQQVKDQCYQDMYAKYGDYHVKDILNDSAISLGSSYLIGITVSAPFLGAGIAAIETALMSLYHYGRSEHERFLKDLTERGLGMVEVHYSAYGVQGDCYVPWDGSSKWDTGTYPYARR